MTTVMALCFLNFAVAQEAASPDNSSGDPGVQDSTQCAQCPRPNEFIAPPNSNAIMGFETANSWNVSSTVAGAKLSSTSTTVRTQGTAAFAVIDPTTEITLTSRPIASGAQALSGIGNAGAILQLDVQVTTDTGVLSPGVRDLENESVSSSTNATSIEGFVTVQSRGLINVPIGTVSFAKYRTGIYNTLAFSIPESASSALKGAAFSDLVFQFQITAAHDIEGVYLFDNLRIHSVELVQSPKGIAPPSGYGRSINLLVPGNKIASQAYSLGRTQIPQDFHLKNGTAGATTVQFQIGLDAIPTLTCTYIADNEDTTDQTYILKSCTGNYEAGDLVNSNWTSLGILQGTSTQKLQAQLVISPLGDIGGSGILPPMPTFWGDTDTCATAPVHGKVVTTSSSCAKQRAKANQIVTEYFQQVNSADPSPNWVVAPVPAAALRNGNLNPSSFNNGGSNPVTGTDTPFDTGGDLNPGGSFDAYWKLSGNLTPSAVTGTDENLTHFDATFTAHGVLFGDDVDVVDAKVTADTDSGETTPTYKPAKSSGTLGFYVFGEEIPSGGLTFNPSTSFNVDPSWTQEYDLPSIQIWIFDITLGALVDADLKASGSAALSGADLSVVPTASLGGHISGGISLGIADGSVDAKINLITISAPMTAQVKWVLDTSPAICSATLNGSLKGDITLASGGGEVDLDATYGICPICHTSSYTLVKWQPLVSKSWNLFNDTLDVQLFGLPAKLCNYPITVKVVSPTSGANLSSGLPVTLTGSAAPNDTTVPYTSTYTWKFTPGANAGTLTINPAGANSANPTVTFGPPTSGTTSTWTIGLTATTTVRGAGGTTIQETATATPVTVKVSNIAKGVYISQVSSANNGVAIPDPTTGVLQVGNIPGTITFSGLVSGGSNTLTTTFTVAPCNDGTAACTSPGTPVILTTAGTAAAPSASWTGFGGGYYKVTMNTKAGPTSFGTASAVIYGFILF